MGLFEIPSLDDVSRRDRPARPIGGVDTREKTSFTTFIRQHDEWIHGPEATAHFQLETRAFRRASKDPHASHGCRTVNFYRYEITVTLAEASRHHIEPGDTLVIADLPFRQRRYQTARLQTYSRMKVPFIFEDLDAYPMPQSLTPRAMLDDMQAIDLLHRIDVNLFENEPIYSAAIAGTQAGAFIGYDDYEDEPIWYEEPERRARHAAHRTHLPPIAARSRKDGSYAFGIVKDLAGTTKDLWLSPEIRQIWDEAGAGTYRLPAAYGGQSVSPEVASRLADHVNVAIFQALAGAGAAADQWLGKPVSARVLDLLHEYIATAVDRFDGRSKPDDEA